MTLSRRSFIHTSMLAGAGLFLRPDGTIGRSGAAVNSMFGVHPFIEENPDAVFIMKTDVDLKTNGPVIKEAGLSFGRSVFGLSDNSETGIPLSHKIVMKPNLTCRQSGHAKYTVEGTMGIVTDSNFMEGIIEGMKELDIPASQFFMREVNCPDDLADGGYIEMAERTGINLAGIDTPYTGLQPEQMVWMDVPDGGSYFKRIPYLWPVNAPDTWLLNVSKLKAHGMGLTLCAKNMQGTIAMNYQAHCTRYGKDLAVNLDDVHSDAFYNILNNHNRHVNEGYPRWDRPEGDGGLWMETWASRCLDNNATTVAGLHVIEGIYGRDGNFVDGPSPEGLATDYMTNYIIFGKNQFYVDIVGHWLGGHEPGNFGLFHMAMERGMISTINPEHIPVYDWTEQNGATIANLKDYQRTDLRTYYLQKNYNGGTEERWHMVNEAYDYSIVGAKPHFAPNFSLQPNFPNPVDSQTTIPYEIPNPGKVRIEVVNSLGRVVDVLVDSDLPNGKHMAIWDGSQMPTGLYLYRMSFEGSTLVQKLFVYH